MSEEKDAQPYVNVYDASLFNSVEALADAIRTSCFTEIRVHPHLIESADKEIRRLRDIIVRLAERIA